MREAKRFSWKNFVSKINSNTPSRTCSRWNMLHKIQGNDISQPVKHLKVDDNSITDIKEIANTLANTIAYNSSSNHYSSTFQSHKTICEKNDILFPPADNEPYNLPITFTELNDAIRTAHDSSTGPDLIHYQILKHLPYSSLQLLLTILNKYWLTDTFPLTWHKAVIIPVAKPGKDSENPNNYCPIALTSCLCKTFEKTINNRLMWYLEKN